ncbi:hypothetical protein ACET8I_12250 [Aeromonas veronii]
MNFKLSHIALAFVASVSFYAAAENVIPNSVVVSDANITVAQDASVGIVITPESGVTVSAVKTGGPVSFAKFKLSGKNVAVRFLDAQPQIPNCTFIYGINDKKNKIDVCMDGLFNQFDAGGFTYSKGDAGIEYDIRGGSDNAVPAVTTVGGDTYKLTMEAVQYTL